MKYLLEEIDISSRTHGDDYDKLLKGTYQIHGYKVKSFTVSKNILYLLLEEEIPSQL